MKRNTKPFSVEIKKPRVQSQHPHLPPKRLFELTSVEPAELVQKEDAQAMKESAPAPRILPSIVEPAWNSPEPVGRQRSLQDDNQEQMELDWPAASSEAPVESPLAVLVIVGAVSQADTSAAREDKAPIHELQAAPGKRSKKERKPRQKKPGAVERAMQSESTSQPERVPEPVALEISIPPSAAALQRRRTKRLAKAAQLPRSERWKRRLHPASR